MQEEKKLLEVGDVIYHPVKYGRGYEGTSIIKRVTAKQAETENGLKLWRELERGYANRVGRTSYGINRFPVETDQLKELWQKQIAEKQVSASLDKLSKIKPSNLSYVELEEARRELDAMILKYSKP